MDDTQVGELLGADAPEVPDDVVEALYDHAAELITVSGGLTDRQARHHITEAMYHLKGAAGCEEQARAFRAELSD